MMKYYITVYHYSSSMDCIILRATVQFAISTVSVTNVSVSVSVGVSVISVSVTEPLSAADVYLLCPINIMHVVLLTANSEKSILSGT